MSNEDTGVTTAPDDWEYPDPTDQVIADTNESEGTVEASEGTVEPSEPTVEADSAATDDTAAPAGATPDTQVDGGDGSEDAPRGPRTSLELDLYHAISDLVSGKVALDDGVLPTPHILARLVHEYRKNDPEKAQWNAPSSGAVSACLDRWAEIGFIKMSPKPKAFVDFTDDGCTLGLSALKERNRANRKAARVAAKGTEPAPVTGAPADAPAPGDEQTALPQPDAEPVDYQSPDPTVEVAPDFNS